MSDEERAREIVQMIRAVDPRYQDSDPDFAISAAEASNFIASALSAARDEERDRISTWLRDAPIPSNWASILAAAIAANQHRESKP